MSKVLPGYVAAILDEESVASLRGLAIHQNIYCHHVTLAYKPTKEVWEKYAGLIMTQVTLIVRGIKQDDKGQAVLIEGIPSENEHPHITVSCAEGVPPKYSNDLLKGPGDVTPMHLSLSALVQFIPFKS